METATPAPPLTPPPPARWLPLIGLMAVILFVTFGGFLFSGIPEGSALGGEVEVGNPVEIAGRVTIRPAGGWEVASANEDPLPPGVQLTGGGGWLLAAVPVGTGTPEELVEFYVSTYLEPQASQLSVGSAEPLTHSAGSALTASYVGAFEGVGVPLEGEVIAIVAPSGVGVVLDGWAQQGTYGAVSDQVAAMAASVVIP